MLKKLMVVLVSVALMLSVISCVAVKDTDTEDTKTDTEETADTDSVTKGGKILGDNDTLSIVVGSHESWPYQEDWKQWQYIREIIGGTLDIQAIPYSEFDTKINLIISTRDLPDLMHFTNRSLLDRFGPEGAFLDILENIDKTPNFKKWVDTCPGSEAELMTRISGDGHTYHYPTYGNHTVSNVMGWLYRKDIFDKHGLNPPDTYDDIYTLSKKLREIYPESYPLCMRRSLNKFFEMGTQWGTYLQKYAYYNFDAEKMEYGGFKDEFKQMVLFYKKMFDEKLIPDDFLTMSTKGWTELVFNDRAFMFIDYGVRIDWFQEPARQENPDFTLASFEPPKGGKNGTRNLPRKAFSSSGYAICNTGDKDNTEKAFNYIDWFYSDEGIAIASWGKEGETYKMVDGKKEFITDDEGTRPLNLYGIGSNGTSQVVDPLSIEAKYTEENMIESRKIVSYFTDYRNPIEWLPITKEEQKIVDEFYTPANKHLDEQISKIMLSQRPVSEWDAFVQELKDMGVEKALKVYQDAFDRIMK